MSAGIFYSTSFFRNTGYTLLIWFLIPGGDPPFDKWLSQCWSPQFPLPSDRAGNKQETNSS